MTPKYVALIALLAGVCRGGAAQPSKMALGLETGDRTWQTLTTDAGKVDWGGAGADMSVQLAPDGGYAGIVAELSEPPTGLIDAELAAAAEGSVELIVQLTRDGDVPPQPPAWVTPLSDGNRRRLAARLAPPSANGASVYLHLGARGKGTARLSGLTLVAEDVLGPVDDSSVKPPLPADWEPDGTLDARAREIGSTTQLLVQVKSLEVSVVSEVTCTLGGFVPQSALVAARGTGRRTLSIAGEFTEGVICDARDYPITKAGTSRAPLRLQGLLPGTHAGKLTISSGKESASLPMRVTVARSYPAFGVAAGDAPLPIQWQLREIRIAASAESTSDALLAQVQPFIEQSVGIPAVFFDGVPGSVALRAFVEALKGKVGLYSAAWRGDRPFGGDAPEAEAEALLAAARELHGIVSTTDLDAACLSPVFDHTVNQEGSPENRLLDACLAISMDDHFAGVVVTSPPLPPGGVLGESVNGRNLRAGSSFWTDFDMRQYPYGIEALMTKHNAHLPILTSTIAGPASTDERLDGLKVAKALAIAAYAGATGATFLEEPVDGQIALTRDDGSLSAAGIAVKQLCRELTGAAPVRRSWEGNDVSGRLGDPIVVLPFVRDDEVMLVTWNNTSATRGLTLTLRSIPYSEHILTIARDDPFIDRSYQDHFQFSKRAAKAKRQQVYLRLAPLQMKVVRYRLRVALPTWLESLAFTTAAKVGPDRREHDDRPWWQRLRDWAEGNE